MDFKKYQPIHLVQEAVFPKGEIIQEFSEYDGILRLEKKEYFFRTATKKLVSVLGKEANIINQLTSEKDIPLAPVVSFSTIHLPGGTYQYLLTEKPDGKPLYEQRKESHYGRRQKEQLEERLILATSAIHKKGITNLNMNGNDIYVKNKTEPYFTSFNSALQLQRDLQEEEFPLFAKNDYNDLYILLFTNHKRKPSTTEKKEATAYGQWLYEQFK